MHKLSIPVITVPYFKSNFLCVFTPIIIIHKINNNYDYYGILGKLINKCGLFGKLEWWLIIGHVIITRMSCDVWISYC